MKDMNRKTRNEIAIGILMVAIYHAFLFSLAPGQIDLSGEYEPYAPIEARCACVVPEGAKATYTWRSESPVQTIPVENGNRCFVWAPPGKHTVELTASFITIDWDEQTFDVQQKQFTESFLVKGSSPNPKPDPEPDPTPPPAPESVTGVIVIEESSRRTPQMSSLLQDIRQRGLPGVSSNRLWIIDKDQTHSGKFGRWINYVGGKPLPYLVGVSRDDAVAIEGRLPSTYQATVSLIQGTR